LDEPHTARAILAACPEFQVYPLWQNLQRPSPQRRNNPKNRAKASIAALEGAMIVASVNQDNDIFEAVAQLVKINPAS